jgi:hypothetical protein
LSVNGNEAQACLSPCQHFCRPQWLAIWLTIMTWTGKK